MGLIVLVRLKTLFPLKSHLTTLYLRPPVQFLTVSCYEYLGYLKKR